MQEIAAPYRETQGEDRTCGLGPLLLVAVRGSRPEFRKLWGTALKTPFNAGEVLPEQRIVSFLPAGSVQFGGSPRKLVRPGQRNRQRVVHIGIGRHQASRSFQVSRGLSHAVLGQKRTPHIVMSVGIVGLRLQRNTELGDGVVQLVLEEECKAIVKPGKAGLSGQAE